MVFVTLSYKHRPDQSNFKCCNCPAPLPVKEPNSMSKNHLWCALCGCQFSLRKEDQIWADGNNTLDHVPQFSSIKRAKRE